MAGLALGLAAMVATACGSPRAEVGPLRERQVQLQREVDGLRATLDGVSRTGSLFGPGDLVVSLEESFVEGLVSARLPITVKAQPYTLTLTRADVGFTGTSTVKLHGVVTRDGLMAIEAEATVLGALADVTVDVASSTLRASVAVDHIEIARIAGMEGFLSGATLDDVAMLVREQAIGQLPSIEIPVRVQQQVDIPAIEDGPVRLEGGRLPISAKVSRVFAGNQRLWIAIGLSVGEVSK